MTTPAGLISGAAASAAVMALGFVVRAMLRGELVPRATVEVTQRLLEHIEALEEHVRRLEERGAPR